MESIIFYRYFFFCKFTEDGSWKCPSTQERAPWHRLPEYSHTVSIRFACRWYNFYQPLYTFQTIYRAPSGLHGSATTTALTPIAHCSGWKFHLGTFLGGNFFGGIALGESFLVSLLTKHITHSNDRVLPPSMMELLVPLWSRPMVPANFLLFCISGWLHPR